MIRLTGDAPPGQPAGRPRFLDVLAARFDLAELADDVRAVVDRLVETGFVPRLADQDHTVFGQDPTEVENRLGWLDVPWRSKEQWPALVADSNAVSAGTTDVVVMGMGGSSLFPEVLRGCFAPQAGRPRLHVIDTTHPDAVARIAAACPPSTTFHLAASKSGSTVETRSHLAFFWSRHPDPSRFGVVTDPGSALGAQARSLGFARVWENDPNIGGRFSALSLFGLVPAALLGLNGTTLLDGALDMADALEPTDDDADHLGLLLGATMAVAARAGRDKLTFIIAPEISAFGVWVEQLIAESTGKHGEGVVPVVDEVVGVAEGSPADRLVVVIGDARTSIDAPMVRIPVEDPLDLGALVYLFEYATAVCGAVLGVNPFDQPDVEAAKIAARAALSGVAPAAVDVTSATEAVADIPAGTHVAIGAFVDPGGPDVERLVSIRERLGRRFGVATSLGIGPRFLHSTGQLHKGGPAAIRAIQLVGAIATDLAVPGEDFTFGRLLHAQADGDLASLRSAGRAAFRVELDDLDAALD